MIQKSGSGGCEREKKTDDVKLIHASTNVTRDCQFVDQCANTKIQASVTAYVNVVSRMMVSISMLSKIARLQLPSSNGLATNDW